MDEWDEVDLDDLPKWALGILFFSSNPRVLTGEST